MMGNISSTLTNWIADGGREIGEIHLAPVAGGYILQHRDDLAAKALVDGTGAEAARDLAQYDDAGEFRPLKTAPNLRHGWRLRLTGIGELHRALDYFYPAMLGVWHSHRQGCLVPIALRETLARQTGMYAVTKKIGDAEAQSMIGLFCRSNGGCLKHILWQIAPGMPITSLPAEKLRPVARADELPLLCHEACNLLVARTREVVKAGGARG